ncbi:MAG: hypothetical protein JW885_11535 [Deltaproteobacteria bacterium]|nr:hypothetical protein [Candidatus Zymogenaceae bacterium]
MGSDKLDRSAVGVIEVFTDEGWVDLGIIHEEVIRVNGVEMPHIDTTDRPFGIDRILVKDVSVDIDFIWAEVGDIALWRLVMGGGAVTVTESGTEDVADEEVTLSGTAWTPIFHAADFMTDCTVSVHDTAGGGVAYAQDVDYYLDRRGGHLVRIPGGAITDGQTVFVDYRRRCLSGRCFHPWEGGEAYTTSLRLTKPLTGGDVFRVTHSRVVFSCSVELPLAPGSEGKWAGVKSGVRFLKDIEGIYGPFGRWEIYTP